MRLCVCPALSSCSSDVLYFTQIYVAHRAADPKAYPLRQALIERNGKRAKLAEQYGPTKVHLQVYDGACHVLPLFSCVSVFILG